MGIFGKREVFDLTDERNRRLIRESQAIERGTQRDDTGFVDLSSGSSGASAPSTASSASSGGTFGDFFGGGGSSTPASTPSTGNSFDFLGGSTDPSSNGSHASVGHLKVKLEDVEYKLDRFLERLEKIESSLGL